VRLALAGDEPDEPVVDWEARVAAASPGLQREAVADDLADAAGGLAVTLDELTEDEWQLTGLTGRGRPVPVTQLALIAVHEGSHHLLDVGRVLRAARGR
jgi:predicted carbohydrate-binding protein with CBM5 and CBM33 domain